MRIQHNIMAMNAYRNYNNNASSLSKNLEKLSSGYKINRAGDDAAGLAISEKMRAQLKGLTAAQENVKDGVNLVKTAEGAMQEIQDMLSRMKYLATKSANGTFDDEVDRNALQDEVDALRDEINRIADSANFNGINLLDGSMSSGGASGGSNRLVAPSVDGFDLTLVAGSKGKTTIAAAGLAKSSVGPGTYNVTVELNGKSKTYTYTIGYTSGATGLEMKDANGAKVSLADAGGVKASSGGTVKVTKGATVSATKLGKDLISKLRADFGDNFSFTLSSTSGNITVTAKTQGVDAFKTGSVSVSYTDSNNISKHGPVIPQTIQNATDPKWEVTAGKFETAKASELKDKTYTINGVKFAFMTDDNQINAAQANNPSLHIIKVAGNNGKLSNTQDMTDFALAIKNATGLDVTAVGGKLTFYGNKTVGAGTKGGLQLQIGDTADSFNQMNVSISDMHTSSLGIHGISVASIDGASNAVDAIKKAINSVSSVRGTLGAVQNRLEHTQNNLSVMTENVQDAEATIRDTDVADEMMAYTKNNILIQSAQAMLAQANAVPQGVLQLLG